MLNRLFIIVLIGLAVNQFSGISAWAASVLQSVNRADEATHLRIFLRFDRLPSYTVRTDGKRLDLRLAATQAADPLTGPPSDGRLVKMTSKIQRPDTLLSFYFRYPPQQVHQEESPEKGMLTLDVQLGNQLSANASTLTTTLKGVTILKPGQDDPLNPVNLSVYARDWPSFFTKYETSLTLQAPPKLLLPPFPLAAAIQPAMPVKEWLPEETRKLAGEGQWSQVWQALSRNMASQPQESLKERLVLSYGEALVRGGRYQEPYRLLQKIGLEYPDTTLARLARVLFLYLEATHNDAFSAYIDLLSLRKDLEQTSVFTPYLNIMLAELALLTGRPKQAQEFLDQEKEGGNKDLQAITLLRRADVLYAQHERPKALAAYLAEAARSDLIDTDPQSLAQFADLLYAEKMFREAGRRYARLAELLADSPAQSLALFRKSVCDLNDPDTGKQAAAGFAQIQSAFPGTEGALRALLKQTDLQYGAGTMPPEAAQAVYGQVALEAGLRSLREEGAFKQALVNALAGKHHKSVEQCMEILRAFQSGNLRTETTALLIQQLPGVIGQLVADKEYIKALVLAKQNREYFTMGWIQTGPLHALAEAYSRLGLLSQAVQTYQYLFEVAEDAQKEALYPALIRSLTAAGLYARAEEYADRYLLRYPQGKGRTAVFLLKAYLLYTSGQSGRMLRFLDSPDAPHLPELELMRGQALFSLRDWEKVVDTLGKPELRPLLTENRLLFPLAESSFQTGRDEQAAALFQELTGQAEYADQARFRLAQIEARRNNTDEALKLFTELAEKGEDLLWRKMAKEEAGLLRLQKDQKALPAGTGSE